MEYIFDTKIGSDLNAYVLRYFDSASFYESTPESVCNILSFVSQIVL